MATRTTSKSKTKTKRKPAKKKRSKSSENGKFSVSADQVLHSTVFAAAMNVASRISYGKTRIFRLLHRAFEKLRNESTRHSLASDAKDQVFTMVRMLKAYSTGVYKVVPKQAIIRITAGIIYFVWILDLIPDFIPFIGFADDIAVIIWIYNGLSTEIEEFRQWEEENNTQTSK